MSNTQKTPVLLPDSDFGSLLFRCNICGSSCVAPVSSLQREESSCDSCGSTVRMRGIVHSLSMALFGESFAIEDFPERKNIVGIGMSDWDPYADRLKEKLSYTNTFYHKEPKLDVTNITSADEATLDFIISTDVYEHVCPPVSIAFENTYKMLKPGGSFIFSVPYSLEDSTLEHFPELHDWKLEKREVWTLINQTKEGKTQEYSDLVFHGGEGETLEMRVFCEKDLLNILRSFGFDEVSIMKEPCFPHGVYWPCLWSLPMVARKK
jgi:SAM-dependent methyltransferase